MGTEKGKSPPTFLITLGVIAGILASQFAQGKLQHFNITVALLFLVSIGIIIWLFVYSRFGRWLNRWMMSSFDDFQKEIDKKSPKKKETDNK